jgi:gp16 family phage-associated protein
MYMFSRTDLDRIREDFYQRGESVAEWARAHGFDPNLVYQILNGRCLARRGTSHQIALALGLKPAKAEEREQVASNSSKEVIM